MGAAAEELGAVQGGLLRGEEESSVLCSRGKGRVGLEGGFGLGLRSHRAASSALRSAVGNRGFRIGRS